MIRVSTGVEGLDEMLNGGFSKGRIILVSGGPGTGKTILALQYLIRSLERGESGVYVTLEEPLVFIMENANSLGWNFRAYEKKNSLRLLDFYAVPYGSSSEIRTRQYGESTLSILKEISKAAKEVGAEHIVIDPITSIAVHEQSAGMKRYRIAEIINELRRTGCTSILTSEIVSAGEFYIEEFLADGVLRLEKTVQNFNLINVLLIEKMRGVKYDEQPRRYIIDEGGLKVYHTEPVRPFEPSKPKS